MFFEFHSLCFYQSCNVGVEDFFFLVGQGDEGIEDALKRFIVEIEAELFHAITKRVAAAVLAEYQIRSHQSDILRLSTD